MKLEYLIKSKDENCTLKVEDIRKLIKDFDNLKIENKIIKNIDCSILSIESPNNNNVVAVKLSDLHHKIMNKFEPIIITDESSQYFNKTLFPLINKFERNLRKLIYLVISKESNKEYETMVKGLEHKDLGEIFFMLFTDSNFIAKTKTKINREITWPFNKTELIRTIDEMNEECLWDKISDGNIVKTLKENYIKVKDYRNDVMHAHYMSSNDFNIAKKLFEKINEEIDGAIIDIIGNEIIITGAFNEGLSVVLSQFSSAIKSIQASYIENYKESINLIASELARLSLPQKQLLELINAIYKNAGILSTSDKGSEG